MQLHPALRQRRRGVAAVLTRSLALGPGLVVVLAGCGGPAAPAIPGPLPNPHDFTLALSATQVTLTAGAATQLDVTVTRDAGFTDPVTLSLNGAPTGLTATFTPDGANPDLDHVTLQAAAAVVPLDYAIAISGAAGIEQEDAPFTATVQDPVSFQVQGRVVDLFRHAIANATVTIAGASATSAADGSFSIPGVQRPYNAVVTFPAGNEVHEFMGLNRTNPVLPVLDKTVVPAFSAQISGTLTGASANGSKEITEVAYASPEANGGTILWPGDGPDFGPFKALWEGPTTTQGSLVALKWSVGPDGLPAHYVGFASDPLNLTDQQDVTGSDIQLAAVGTSYLSGTVNAPTGFAVASKTLWATAGPYTGMALGIVGGTDPLFTFATPVAGLPLGVQAKATLGSASSTLYRANLQPNQVVDLTLPTPPTLGSPTSSMTVDHTTVFQWTPVAETISVLALTPAPGISGPAVYVYSGAASAGLPQPPVFTLPTTSTRYQWTVWGWGMYSDMDAFTDPAVGLGSFGLDRDALVTVAEPIGLFTSATP